MRTRKISVSVILTIFLLTVVPFVSLPAVFPTSLAQSYPNLDGSTCGIDTPAFTDWIILPDPSIGFPGVGFTVPANNYQIDGWWHPLLHTCQMAANAASGNLVIPSNTKLILNGYQLNVNTGATLDNKGTIDCASLLSASFLSCNLLNSGTITNEGTINVGSKESFALSASAVPVACSTAILAAFDTPGSGIPLIQTTCMPPSNPGIFFDNEGVFTNTGTGTLSCTLGHIKNGGQITNLASGNINGLVCPLEQTNNGRLTNFKDGTISVSGAINNEGMIDNSGTFTLGSSIAQTIPGTYVVKLAVPLWSEINNYNGGVLNNTGTLTFQDLSLLNNGVNISASLSADYNVGAGTIVNNGTMNFIGSSIDNANGVITNGNGGVIGFLPWEYVTALTAGTKLFSADSWFLNGQNATNNLSPAFQPSKANPPLDTPYLLKGSVFDYDEFHSQFINMGTITLGDFTHFTSSGNLSNYGQILFGKDGTIPQRVNIHDSFGVFEDYGQIQNQVELNNYGNFTLECGGSVSTDGATFDGSANYLVPALNIPVTLSSLTQFDNKSSQVCSPQDTTLNPAFSIPPPVIPDLSNSTSTTSTSTTTTTTSTSAACDTYVDSSCTTSTNVEGGTALVDQSSSTGVYVQISGSSASNGTSVTVTSSDLSGQPSGTTNIHLSGESFYDVNVSQTPSLGSSAMATICINATSPSTTMEYWNGTSWVEPFDITVSGNTVCGTVPVSALTGTPIVIGSPPSSGPPPAMVDGNVTIYSSTDTNGEILFTANATVSDMHSAPFTESATPQFGTLPNGTYGYLGYYQGTFAAVSGGQKGANVSITVTYGRVSETGSALSPGVGNKTYVDFIFNSTPTSQAAVTLQLALLSVTILSSSILALMLVVATLNFRGGLPKLSLTFGRRVRSGFSRYWKLTGFPHYVN